MRFLILAHQGDETALRVFARLRARHPTGQVKLVSSEELIYAPHWSHRLGEPPPATEITLADRTVLSSEDLGVVFNRLRYVHMPHFGLASEADRNFAVMEMYALWLSWLESLPCPVINPASTRGLGAQERSQVEWLALASQAGLPAQGYAFSSDPRAFHSHRYTAYWRDQAYDEDGYRAMKEIPPILAGRHPTFYAEPTGEKRAEILVVGERVIADLAISELADQYTGQLIHLARLAGCEWLKVAFAQTAGQGTDQPASRDCPWVVCKVTAFPQSGDPQAIQALVDLLEARLTG
jgi:hypothetical protein